MKSDLKLTIGIQLLSIVIAFIVWTTIINIIRPIVNGSVTVPITMENENAIYEQNKAYNVLDPRVCKITYKVESSQLKLIRQSDFTAYVDLRDLANGNEHLEIHHKVLNNVGTLISNVEVEPKTLHVVIDDVKRNQVELKYELNGEVKKGHSVGEVILSPNVMYLSGSDELLSQVSHALVEIPLKEEDEAFSGIAVPKLIGVDGKEMSKDGITLSANEINYTVVVYARKTISLNPVIEGTVKGGYAYEGVNVYPKNIMIDGPRSALASIPSIDLPVINIDGKTETFKKIYPIEKILPAGIKTISTDSVEVEVIIKDNILNKPSITYEEVGPHTEGEKTANTVIVAETKATEEAQ